MRKIVIFISLLFILTFISGCKKKQKEEIIILSSQEKIELLQAMQTPSHKLLLIESQVKADATEYALSYSVDCKLKSYLNLISSQTFTNYTNLDFDIKTPAFNGLGKANLFLNYENAYLDVDATLKVGGTETTIRSKEVMSLSKIIDPSIIIEYYNKINFDALKDLDPIEIVNEANNLIEFIDVYQKGKQYRFEVKVTKDRIKAASENINDVTFAEIIGGLSNDSFITYNIIFWDNVLSSMNFTGKVNVVLSNGFNILSDASFKIDFNPLLPKLPTSVQLASHNPVEFFTILDQLGALEKQVQ